MIRCACRVSLHVLLGWILCQRTLAFQRLHVDRAFLVHNPFRVPIAALCNKLYYNTMHIFHFSAS